MALLLAHAAFVLAFLPEPIRYTHYLIMNPAVRHSVELVLSENWTALLLPYEYEQGRFYWATTVIPFTYAAEVYLGGLGSYLLFSTLFTAVSFALAFALSGSLLFAATLAFMFAFGTQFNYVFTFGNLIAYYLVFSYVAVNFATAFVILTGRMRGVPVWAAFAASLAVVALANEVWLNYATALIVATGFGVLWAARHGEPILLRRSAAILAATALVLAIYLGVRLQYASQYLRPGNEEELLITYSNALLAIDDAIANVFTLLHMVLSNYLPSFLTGSLAFVYLDQPDLVAEQHGYHQPRQHLVPLSYQFLWRFHAGVLVTLFLIFAARALLDAWRRPSQRSAFVAALCLMVLASFGTHLAIKIRPYTTVPALPYKAAMSINAFTVLLAFQTWMWPRQFASAAARRTVVGLVWASVVLAALTRPAMQSRYLTEVGITGLGDPLGQLLRWLR